MRTPPEIQSSDLLNSDESTVLSSTLGDYSSVVQYEKDAEDTTILDGTQNESPIANRGFLLMGPLRLGPTQQKTRTL